MSNSSQEAKKAEARKKGTVAAATAAASVAVLVAVPAAPALGVIGLGASAVLGYKWFKYRIENSLRF